MSIWVLALIIYVALFVTALVVAFLIDTIRVIAKRAVGKKRGG